MEAQKIQIGQRVQTRTPGKSGTLRGVVVGLDADHYHARVNGWTVYQVRWDRLGVGGGWTADDLIALH